jgi:hypothetical protein
MTEPSRKEAALCCASVIDESQTAGWPFRLHFRWSRGYFNCNGGLWSWSRGTTKGVSDANDTQNRAVGVLDPGQQQNGQSAKDRRLSP